LGFLSHADEDFVIASSRRSVLEYVAPARPCPIVLQALISLLDSTKR